MAAFALEIAGTYLATGETAQIVLIVAYGIIQAESSAMYTVGLTAAVKDDGVLAEQETGVRMAAQLSGQLCTLLGLVLWLSAGFGPVGALGVALAITGMARSIAGGAAALGLAPRRRSRRFRPLRGRRDRGSTSALATA